MNREELEQKVRENYDAWNRHDAAGTVEIIAEDCVSYDNNTEMHGKDAMQAAAEAYFGAFPDLHLDIVSVFVDGNTVLTEWRSRGTHNGDLMGIPATGRSTEARGISLDEFGEDGLVHHSCLYWDTAKLLQDIGVMPAAEAATA
jgi:steroid delta-isomerase-like uncharacterized protein